MIGINMDLTDYQKEIPKFATYPGKDSKEQKELLYLTLGLAGEAGEFTDKIKKILRDGTYDEEALKDELGDVLWYLSRLAWFFNSDLEGLALRNYIKLSDRAKRGVLKGSGDTR